MSGASLNSSINSEDFKSAFAQITADNVIDIIHTYEFRKGEPFVECIMEETSSSISSRRETCKSLVNKLNDKAIAVGMPEAQRQALYQACINACNSADAWNTETLVSKVNEFYGSVVAAEMNHGSKADVSFGDVAQDNIMGARAGIEEQTYKQSVLGTAWEYSLSPDHTLNLIDTITNNSFLPDTAFGTGRSAAYHKIDKFESTIKNLEDIRRTKGEDAFKAAFKKEFGVEYSQDALNNYVNLKHKFDTAVTQKNTINLMQHLADTVTPDNVDEIIENFISAFPEKDRSKYRAALNSTIQANMNKGYSKATAFEQCLNTYIQDARRVYNEATEGQDLSLLGNSLNGAFDGMFGAKAGINSEVREYVVRQQKGEQYTATSGKIAIAVVASVVTQNPAIGAIIVTAGGMAQDTLQMGTSHYHGDGAFGTDLSGARASAAAGENLINGVGTYVGGNFGNITQELGTAARLGSDIVLDSAMSVGGDVMNGNEVTLESIGGSVLSASFGNFVGHNTRNEIFGAIAKEGASSVVDGALNVNSIPTNTEYSSQNLGESLASSMGVSKSLGDNIANNEIEDNNKPKGA